jgi:hypothetical protein
MPQHCHHQSSAYVEQPASLLLLNLLPNLLLRPWTLNRCTCFQGLETESFREQQQRQQQRWGMLVLQCTQECCCCRPRLQLLLLLSDPTS